MGDFRNERKEYQKFHLTESDIDPNPFVLLADWLKAASEVEQEHTAMVLSTCANNIPSTRVVLLKELKQEELVFFTNYNSRKAREMEANPIVSLNFFWPHCERQVRIVGDVRRIPEADSDAYFYSRPHESQIGAIVSKQSEYLDSRASLEEAYQNALTQGDQPQRPDHWGGYAVAPFEIEFWQGRPSRLHDRFRYTRSAGSWENHRLYP